MTSRNFMLRSQLLLGASAAALFGAAGAQAQDNPFARRTDVAAVAAQAAAAQARATSNTSAASQRALAAFVQAAKVRQQADQAQVAARAAAAALKSSIPNGLGAGGLQQAAGAEAGGTLWLGALKPVQTEGANGRTDVKIEQTAAQAILNWETFNVGRETDLSFAQQNSKWVVLNRVNDPGANPTQILGSIKAQGTVMVLNRNGVVFTGTSQVNVGSLVAAAGNIGDDQFLKDGIYSPIEGTPSTGIRYLPLFDELAGDVKALAGSRIETNTPVTVTRGGGAVMLFGGTVEAAGSITTPRGQTLLAAGDNVLLRPGYSPDNNMFATTYGNEVESLIKTGSMRGIATNAGVITAARGDITISGGTVTQAGVAVSTTTVNTRGTIHLHTPSRYSDVDPWSGGAPVNGLVTLAPGSLTTILPELDSTETALDTQRDGLIAASAAANTSRYYGRNTQFTGLSSLNDRQDQSRIDIVTNNVRFAEGSQAIAQGGQVTVSAMNRVQIDKGAWIDVSGVRDVALNATSNLLTINVQGNELRDAPVNRDAAGKPLFNQNIVIDARDLVLVPAGTDGYAGDRYYTRGGLLEVGGYLANIGHTIGEWSAVGGTVSLHASEIVAQRGATFNLAGGSLNYAGGTMYETLLQGADGRMYTAGNAPANVRMVSVGKSFQVLHPRWGDAYTQSYSNPFGRTTISRYDPGYIIGRDGGQLLLSAPVMMMDATIAAESFQGVFQTDARPRTITDSYKLARASAPLGGGIRIANLDTNNQSGNLVNHIRIVEPSDVTPEPIGLDDAIPSDPELRNVLDASTLTGLGSLFLRANEITIDAPLTLANGGSLSALANVVTVNSDIVARGGAVLIAETFHTPALTAGNAVIDFTADASIDTRGLWTNLLLDPLDRGGLAFRNGGSVSLIGKEITLARGSWIDASSGGALSESGALIGAVGGDITILSSGPLALGATLRSNGVTRGGALSLQAKGYAITGVLDPVIASGVLSAGMAAPSDLFLSDSFTILAGTPLPLPVSVPNPTLIMPGQVTPVYFLSFDAQSVTVDTRLSDGAFANSYNPETETLTEYRPGDTIPAGTEISLVELYSGATVPIGLFRDGISVAQTYSDYAAGAVASVDVTYRPGAAIPAGTILPQQVSIISADVMIDASFFDQGFSSYKLNGLTKLTVAGDTKIAPTMAVYQSTLATAAVRTGADPASAMALVEQPLFFDDPIRRRSTQRAGVDVTLLSGAAGPEQPGQSDGLGGGSLAIAAGASITVDPGRKIHLVSGGQVTIDGTLTAPGGAIVIENKRPVGLNVDYGTSVWIGGSAVLDVSARPHIARDQDGLRFGVVPDGGTISVGGSGLYNPKFGRYDTSEAFVILRPGARLTASGTSGTIDLIGGGHFQTSTGQPLTLASDGGTITLSSYQGIYNDAMLEAKAGGAGAAGGTLNFIAEGPVYGGIVFPIAIPDALQVARKLYITDETRPTLLSADLEAGMADENLKIGESHASAQMIRDGGFDSATMWGRGAIIFDGDVNLTAGRRIDLRQGYVVGNLDPDGKVTVEAPYVYLGGRSEFINPPPYPGLPSVLPARETLRGGSLTVEGQLVDVRDAFEPNFGDVRIVSQSDIRFLPVTSPSNGAITAIRASDTLSLIASQIYPVTNAQAEISAGVFSVFDPMLGYNRNVYTDDSKITIGRIDDGAPAPDMPMSVFGSLSLRAAKIEQGGIVRAPFGQITLSTLGPDPDAQLINLLPGSITSISADGLAIPYGGTTDGVTYKADGLLEGGAELQTGYFVFRYNETFRPHPAIALNIDGFHIQSAPGSIIDVSGGGTLLGAAFVQGRGGSVDTLIAPRIRGAVYAIVPGMNLAPVAGSTAEAWTGAVPTQGQQVTISEGVPGLPAGTYTLLPANYALLPGAFRVELGTGMTNSQTGVIARPDGSYALGGYKSVAHTGIKDELPTSMLITSSATLRTYSTYNEQGYDAFQIASAATFGKPRPLLPRDGKFLNLTTGTLDTTQTGIRGGSLDIRGATDFAPAGDGFWGSLAFRTLSSKFVIARDDTQLAGGLDLTVLRASDILRFNAPNIAFSAPGSVEVEAGVTLSASRISLLSKHIEVGEGATLTTIGRGITAADSSYGFDFGSFDSAFLIVANGEINLRPAVSGTNTTMTIGRDVHLYSEGTVGFTVSEGVNFLGAPDIGARDVALALPSINIGTAETLASAEAAGIVPAGINLDQSFLESLFAGNPRFGTPPVERLTLQATQSVNFYGSVDFDTRDPATGRSRLDDFVLIAPAIYGHGDADDMVNLSAGRVIWRGLTVEVPPPPNYFGLPVLTSAPPGAIIPNGPGTGSSTLNINAEQILFGDPTRGDKEAEIARLLLGFANVNLNASRSVTATSRNTLTYYQQSSAANQPGTGGDLTIATPLLTGEAGSVMRYTIGGALTVRTPEGGAPAGTADVTKLGAEINLTARTVTLDTAVALPSGLLKVNAAEGIGLGDAARIDLGGRTIPFFDVKRETWGGSLLLTTQAGDIVQAAGGTIDLSAVGENAGTLGVSAKAGAARLAGTLLGSGGPAHQGGIFEVRALDLGSGAASLNADFLGLNTRLDTGGFTRSRTFEIGRGDLTIAAPLVARIVDVSVNGGSLTIDGLIDASGATPGTIRLAARDDLRLTGKAILDAHGTALRRDSNGQAIEAVNRGHVELTTQAGTLRLDSGSAIDLSNPDGQNRGRVELNAPRLGETVGDIRIEAAGGIKFAGVANLALNGFWRYSPTDAKGTIVQNNGGAAPVGADGSVGLDQIHQRNTAFIDAALGNGALSGRIAGLTALGDAFHLRPGVEIRSAAEDGDLLVWRDLDLSTYRYGPKATGGGAGEPMSLLIRAGGNLDVKGSITDGFELPGATPADAAFVVIKAGKLFDPVELLESATLPMKSIFAQGAVVGFDVPVLGTNILEMGELTDREWVLDPPYDPGIYDNAYAFPGYWSGDRAYVETGSVTLIYPWGGSYTFGPGAELPQTLRKGTVIAAGTSLRTNDPANGVLPLTLGPAFAASKAAPVPLTVSVGVTLPTAFTATGRIVTPGATFEAGDLVPAGTTIPKGSVVSAGASLPVEFKIANTLFPAGASLDLVGGAPTSTAITLSIGESVPAGTTLSQNAYSQTARPLYAAGEMQAPGTLSASLRLVAGADLGAADTRAVRTLAALNGGGNLTLSDTHVGVVQAKTEIASVLRTGTGSLDLIAGGNYRQTSLYGVYTAGTDMGNSVDGIYFPDHGGDLLVSAQGTLSGYQYYIQQLAESDQFKDWYTVLGAGNGAQGINFGKYVIRSDFNGQYLDYDTLLGFNGMGTLGGGNVMVVAGGDAGALSTHYRPNFGFEVYGDGLTIVAAGTQRVTDVVLDQNGLFAGQTLEQNGGGDVTIKVGGKYNPARNAVDNSSGSNEGTIGVLRGDLRIEAGSLGTAVYRYGVPIGRDPRPIDPNLPRHAELYGGPALVLGDAAAAVRTRGDLMMGGIARTDDIVSMEFTDGLAPLGRISRWTDRTALDLVSAGGDLTPSNGASGYVNSGQYARLPAQLRAAAPGGNIYLSGALYTATASSGQLDLLAGDAIYYTDFYGPGRISYEDPIGLLRVGDLEPSRVYAVNGDIVNFGIGGFVQDVFTLTMGPRGGEAVQVRAGRDIVRFGGMPQNADDRQYSPSLFLNNNDADVSVLQAGRDILYANLRIAGPGTLEVAAAGDFYQGDAGIITSAGALALNDDRSGATVAVMAGAGAAGANWAGFANLYLDPENQIGSVQGQPLPIEGTGKVAKTYEAELIAWLDERYGYRAPSAADAKAYFDAELAPEQQRIFLRQVYYAELVAGGREYNDVDGPRLGSYLRGRGAIATLFPETDADGKAVTRGGDITLFGPSGIASNFGGDIQFLAPAGRTLVGIEGTVPPPTAGLVTQGVGDIQMYSRGSILLGLSRVLTTFGGNIVMWSAEGDINAGRGAKTTILLNPPKRVFDNLGNIDLAPQAPSAGAGIATLDPLPEVEPGDVDLIAPLGTIDAGEAGIRVSGNVNLAALQVVNAANIQVKGNASGIPVVAAVNTGALTAASGAASTVSNEAERLAERARPRPVTDLPTILRVRFVGFGDQVG